ncbi:hypothetical protein QNN00_16030 [Bacillus velezensis]|nr:hypothetical protein [Bacillus velezensis]
MARTFRRTGESPRLRIEPGEIEAAIRRIDGIREAAVTARNEHGETALYAYIEGRESDDVRAELADTPSGLHDAGSVYRDERMAGHAERKA